LAGGGRDCGGTAGGAGIGEDDGNRRWDGWGKGRVEEKEHWLPKKIQLAVHIGRCIDSPIEVNMLAKILCAKTPFVFPSQLEVQN